jgi:hypothetical protein
MSGGASRRSDHAANAGMHAYAERGVDHSPRMTVRALLTVEAPLGDVLERCAGVGGVAMPLREADYTVHAFDLFDWGCPDCAAGADFFTTKEAPAGARTAIFNPSFRWAKPVLSINGRDYFDEEKLDQFDHECLLIATLSGPSAAKSLKRNQTMDSGQEVSSAKPGCSIRSECTDEAGAVTSQPLGSNSRGGLKPASEE